MTSPVPDFLQKERAQETASADTLERLKQLIDTRASLLEQIHKQTKELKELAKDLDKVESEDIPGILNGVGLSRLRLSSGEEVSIKTEVYASVAKKNKEAFFKTLQERGEDSLIKKILVVPNPSTLLIDNLFERGEMFDVEKSIHAQTLKSYVRNLLENGEKPPESVSYYTKQKTVVK